MININIIHHFPCLIIIDAIERLQSPKSIQTKYLIHMSILSFLVNLVSLYLFHGTKKHDHGNNESKSKKKGKSHGCNHSHSSEVSIFSVHKKNCEYTSTDRRNKSMNGNIKLAVNLIISK